ncbi:MAG: hypothetical protein IKE01_04770 [Clostridia bacterium]|nr:hypothetical protein [Clostridia bacterium]
MRTCFHTTKLDNLISILHNGLQPIYGNNSALTADSRTGNVSYSAGIQAAVDTFSVFRRFYNDVVEGNINEESFRRTLSQEEYSNHQKSIREILESESFEDWIGNNIYLCFDGNCLSDRHEDKPEDAYTRETIPPEQLKVCVIKNKKNDSICYFSMKDIYCFLYAKNPELEKGLGMWRYEEDINKYRCEDYYMDYLSIEQFCELFPELIANKEIQNPQTYITPKDAVKNALRSTTISETRQIETIDRDR